MRSHFTSIHCAATITMTALFAAIPAVATEPRPSPEARVHFRTGVAALKRGRWYEAYREFKEAYAITPRWTILGNLGIAAQYLERDGEAIDAMDQYVKRGKENISAAERDEVLHAIQALRAGTAEVTLEVPGTFSVVDIRVAESDVVNEYGPFAGRATLAVRAGQHTFKVESTSFEAPAWSVVLLAGDAATHAFVADSKLPTPGGEEFRPDPVAQQPTTVVRSPSHTPSYLLWGVGVAGAGAAIALGVHARGLQQDADRDFAERCPLGATGVDGCDNVTDGSERAARWRTAALVTGASAFGVLIAGTVLYFTADSTTSRTDVARSPLRPWVSPTGFGVTGTF